MRLFFLRPEIRNREPGIEVDAEVVHEADGEEDVHSEFCDFEVGASGVLFENLAGAGGHGCGFGCVCIGLHLQWRSKKKSMMTCI